MNRQIALESLLQLLEDEFRGQPDVRVRRRQLAVLKRSPDLDQDYDPESNDLHSAEGVQVRVRGREYFFPIAWASPRERGRVHAQVAEIREFLEGDF